MMLDEASEDSIPLEAHPEWPSYVKHCEELEKAQSRIGKTPLKTMQWVTRLLAFTDQKLADLSKGDFENLAYEIAVFSLLGTKRLPRIKAGKTILMDSTWGGADWGDKRALGESIPSREQVRTVSVEVKRHVDSLLANRQAEISLHETKLMIQVIGNRGGLFTFHGRIQDKFFFHLARLLADFGPRLQRCEAPDCSQVFVSVRKHQQFCSTRCQSRITTRALRQEKRKQVEEAAQRRQSDPMRRMHDKRESSASKRGGSHGKSRG